MSKLFPKGLVPQSKYHDKINQIFIRSAEDAVFLPNVETAINFVHDAKPLPGETVAVFGQGIVGLLTAALLKQYPFVDVYTFDLFEKRRQVSSTVGVTQTLDPTKTKLKEILPSGADISIEVSGSPRALSDAIEATRDYGRVVIGSWYGNNALQVSLGCHFHRSHMTLVASQVSLIPPDLSGRWTKDRRFELAWKVLASIRPSRFVTHHFPIEKAQEAYDLLHQNPQDVIQIIFKYK